MQEIILCLSLVKDSLREQRKCRVFTDFREFATKMENTKDSAMKPKGQGFKGITKFKTY